MKRSVSGVAMLGSLLLAACQSGTADDGVAVEVLANADQCGRDEAALAWVENTSQLPGAESIVSASEPVLSAGDPVLMVYLGQKPTPGYSAELLDGGSAEGQLRVDLEAKTPEPGAMMAQVITRPCLALGVPASGNFQEVVVSMEADGFPLRLRIPD